MLRRWAEGLGNINKWLADDGVSPTALDSPYAVPIDSAVANQFSPLALLASPQILIFSRFPSSAASLLIQQVPNRTHYLFLHPHPYPLDTLISEFG